MQHQILWISPFRATLMVGVISFAVSFPFVGMVWILNQFSATPGRPNWLILAVFPPLVGVFAAIFAFLATVAHNFIARRVLPVLLDVAEVVENVPESAPASGDSMVKPEASPDVSQGDFYRF